MSYQEHNLTEMEDRILSLFDKGMLDDADIEISDISTYWAYEALSELIAKGLVRKVTVPHLHYELTSAGEQLYNTRAREEGLTNMFARHTRQQNKEMGR